MSDKCTRECKCDLSKVKALSVVVGELEPDGSYFTLPQNHVRTSTMRADQYWSKMQEMYPNSALLLYISGGEDGIEDVVLDERTFED